MEAANALASHLRTNPQDAHRPSSDLARQFGLPGEFVKSVIAGVHRPQAPTTARVAISFRFLRRAMDSTMASFDRAIAKPISFVVWTTLVGVVGVLGLLAIGQRASNSGRFATIPELAFFLVVALHMAAYYRLRMSRHALYGGLALFLTISPFLWIMLGWGPNGGAPLVVKIVAATFGMFVMGAVYAGIGSLMAVLGAYRAIRVKDRANLSLSRQELLERYFELQARLQSHGDPLASRPNVFEWEPALVFRRNPYAVAIGLGVFLRIVTVAIGSNSMIQSQGSSAWQMVALFLSGLVSFAALLVFVAIGFFSESFAKAMAAAIAYAAAWYATLALPAPGFGMVKLSAAFHRPETYLVLSLELATAAIASMGALVQGRAQRDRDVLANEPAAVLAEMVQIQWRLADRTTTVCVMVVDAAKSSEMKSQQDPLAIEYSFREYQDWLEAESKPFGGRIHSTAGDGAVVAFGDPRNAMIVARNIQRGLAGFNARANRLKLPFRLRIGLHSGSVAGNLEDVEFTEIIDIAAHVESTAPIGGIAVTEAVARELENPPTNTLGRLVDGHSILIVGPEDV